MKPNDLTPETFIIGGKAMAKLIDAIAHVYAAGPDRKAKSIEIVTTAIIELMWWAKMELKLDLNGETLDFDEFEEFSDVEMWLQETEGLFRFGFPGLDGCKPESDVEPQVRAVDNFMEATI